MGGKRTSKLLADHYDKEILGAHHPHWCDDVLRLLLVYLGRGGPLPHPHDGILGRHQFRGLGSPTWSFEAY